MLTRAEALAERLLRSAKVGDSVAPSVIAARLGFQVRLRTLPLALCGCHMEGSKVIVVNSAEKYLPRREATIAHELVEAHAPKGRPDHEQFCEAAAAALMLPRAAFIAAVFKARLDLAVLRRAWAWCSWELLALRIADVLPGIRASSWVDGKVRWRSGHTASRVTRTERLAVRLAVKRGRAIVEGPTLVVRAWSLVPAGRRSRAVALAVPLGLDPE